MRRGIDNSYSAVLCVRLMRWLMRDERLSVGMNWRWFIFLLLVALEELALVLLCLTDAALLSLHSQLLCPAMACKQRCK